MAARAEARREARQSGDFRALELDRLDAAIVMQSTARARHVRRELERTRGAAVRQLPNVLRVTPTRQSHVNFLLVWREGTT